jgi:pyruvate dehydrogenase E1 component
MTDLSAVRQMFSKAHDEDPGETREWLDAFDALLREAGQERGRYVLQRLIEHAAAADVKVRARFNTPYGNTIPLDEQPPYPGDLGIEARISALVRWNALAMVVRANKAHGELGGHIASYASAADLFEVGFNHFFKGGPRGDLVYFQPHSAPGVYARAYLEGRLDEEHLSRFRRDVGGGGLSSYPHPWLMPAFWQFPTGSMGLGPITAIYQARFLRYLEHRGIVPASERKVWGFFGDGEMDEPESLAGLSVAARERLDNLVFVINCNLQRLDGPVRGNGSIVQELEGLFAGAGWNVIKVLWGSNWDSLFARDHDGHILRRLHETVDGEFQKYSATDGRFNREHFFNKYPELQALVAYLSDADIDKLRRGGHDPVKIHAAYAAALAHRNQPTVILAKTMKGFGMGSAGQAKMTTHQQKKLDAEALLVFRDRFALPLSDEQVERLDFYRPAPDSPEARYLQARRRQLGGYLPARRNDAPPLPAPPRESFASYLGGTGTREHSTTMVLVRLLGLLVKDPQVGARIVPIVADEARTFGMQNLFRQIGIYSPLGQLYEPEDKDELLYYREARDGQIIEEGITEAGALSSWIAAATSYSTHGVAMLPFYIYYSMFGFQRVGDLIWAAADQRSRGFLIGATAGRTTLSGEGLQHQDGSSHLMASTVSTCRAYDPCFAYELALIVEDGTCRMLSGQEDVFYYLTTMNENYPHPPMPAGVEEGILRGMYRLRAADDHGAGDGNPRAQSRDSAGAGRPAGGRVQLAGSGTILREVIAAADMLESEWNVAADVWSVTSFTELRRDGMETERWNRLHPGEPPRQSWIARCLEGARGPLIAASDYVRAVPDLIRPYVERPAVTLGTDGFGRSDTRPILRRFFEVSREHVVIAALDALHATDACQAAIVRYAVDPDATPPWQL